MREQRRGKTETARIGKQKKKKKIEWLSAQQNNNIYNNEVLPSRRSEFYHRAMWKVAIYPREILGGQTTLIRGG